MTGTIQLWVFFIALFAASWVVGMWLERIYKERGK